jgi:hypothetical protein
VIRLRQAGLETGQIGDIVGMSLATIEPYCRFADRKAGGQAALLKLREHPVNKTGPSIVKIHGRLENKNGKDQ